jgi:hypothetical protein
MGVRPDLSEDHDVTETSKVDEAVKHIRTVLDQWVITPHSERDMQNQIERLLRVYGHALVTREVSSPAGRFDLLYQGPPAGIRLVLELKHRGARVAAVEEQTQRYALTDGADGVLVVTSSNALASKLDDLTELGGKPFRVHVLRSV